MDALPPSVSQVSNIALPDSADLYTPEQEIATDTHICWFAPGTYPVDTDPVNTWASFDCTVGSRETTILLNQETFDAMVQAMIDNRDPITISYENGKVLSIRRTPNGGYNFWMKAILVRNTPYKYETIYPELALAYQYLRKLHGAKD